MGYLLIRTIFFLQTCRKVMLTSTNLQLSTLTDRCGAPATYLKVYYIILFIQMMYPLRD